MKPFVFKLQTALDIKVRNEDRQKEELQIKTKIYMDNLQILKNYENKLLEAQDNVREMQQQRVDYFRINFCLEYINILNERINNQKNVVEECRKEMEAARAKLLILMKERKVIEKLKERHYREYIRESLREEQKLIDEMATISFAHKEPAL